MEQNQLPAEGVPDSLLHFQRNYGISATLHVLLGQIVSMHNKADALEGQARALFGDNRLGDAAKLMVQADMLRQQAEAIDITPPQLFEGQPEN